MLDGSLPKAVDKLAHYKAKFGEARIEKMIPHMKAVGLEEGITFSYGGEIGNTFDSHRLIEWAKRSSDATTVDALVACIMTRYFEREANLADHAVLCDAAADAGLDADAAAAFLNTDELSQETRDAIDSAYTRGVSGVPFFIFNDKYALSGAQPADVVADVLDKVAAEL
ncbi:DSBA oxidoreductase [Thecamonas trahens ATCC 50062]|uniref:DSBA oxidoreductase n=1 Tax=Thecamonas trahens ATCC 50062 TaxID=461836 RepID=A0A0L0DMH1_THETB|nr:DSBA oxidoreductase [Thecamonas trahens ATCC 50062]KNC53519.1 DSBA oxidoreductase [Thecamonas trahens ATCC 50062]|eukprot:XP_013761840.1 DSBA oxidoreductase [Thecamonas trahens ATCC 50062]